MRRVVIERPHPPGRRHPDRTPHLDRAGCSFVQDPAEADVIVVNTCAFIDAARQESLDTILEAAELKKTGRLERLVVAGCMVQRYPGELRDSLPEVDESFFVHLGSRSAQEEYVELVSSARVIITDDD